VAHTVDFTLQLTAATRVTSCVAWVAGAGTANWATDVLTLRRGIATRLGVAVAQVLHALDWVKGVEGRGGDRALVNCWSLLRVVFRMYPLR
jgi:hypothetical protein